MSWPPPPDRERSDGPTDAPPWDTPPPIPPYVPGARRPGGPEDVPSGPPAPPQLRYADWGQRVAATAIDYALIAGLFFVMAVLSAFTDLVDGLAGLAWFGSVGYLGWLNGDRGQSPGKAVLGLKVLREQDGTTLGGLKGLLRAGLLWFLTMMTVSVFIVVNTFWPLRDAKHRAVHDLMFGTVVVSGYPRQRLRPGLLRPDGP